jgi:hypothetical protein
MLILLLFHELDCSFILTIQAIIKCTVIKQDFITFERATKLLGMDVGTSVVLALFLGRRCRGSRRGLRTLIIPDTSITGIVVVRFTEIADALMISM